MNITYNQTYLFPPMSAGQASLGSQYPVNLCGMNNVYTAPYDTSVFPAYVNGYVNPASVIPCKQNKTDMYEPNVDRKMFEKRQLTEQNRNIYQVPITHCHNHVTLPNLHACSFQQDTSNQAFTQTSTAHQLRLPSISVTPNMAANVMSEELDLGYCSFTDLSPLPEVPDGSINNNEMFEAQSAFADIINDVLDSMDSSAFDEYTVLPEHIKTESTTASFYEQPHPQIDDSEENCVKVTLNRSPCSLHESSKHNGQISKKNGHFETEKPGKTRVTCELCNKTLQTKASLRSHMKVHKGEKPFGCNYCGKSFAQKSTLRTHIRTHTGEKPYVCQFCSRSFSDYSTYRKHVRVHTGEKPYTCDICHRRFTQSGNMIRHRDMHFKAEKKNPYRGLKTRKSY